MRPVPTKWETSCKNSFPSYNQIHVVQTLGFKNEYAMVAALFGVQNLLIPWKIPLISIDFWYVQWAISFSSLATCRSFCENSEQFH